MAREATPTKARFNICVPLLEDEEDHLVRLAKLTGLRRYQIMRQALLAFTPAMVDMNWKNLPETKRELAAWETKLALEIAGGNKTAAGTLLGISPSAVNGRISRFRLEVKCNSPGRPGKEKRLELRRVFNEQRNLRLFGREQAGRGGARAGYRGEAPTEGQLPLHPDGAEEHNHVPGGKPL